MIECPNLVKVDGKSVLIFCPQGLDKSVTNYQNIYPNMYVIGDSVDLDKAQMTNPSNLKNLDEGFDIYATQSFNAPDGTAYAISWVGLPDISYPTDTENWANCLSQVKKLSIKDGKLIQQPVESIKTLRHDEETLNSQLIKNSTSGQYELELTIKENQTGNLYLAANDDLSENLRLEFDTKNGKLILDRSKAGDVAVKYGQTRSVDLDANKEVKLDIFVDHSLIEIFVNDGEHVVSGRFFANTKNAIKFDQKINYDGKFWNMESIM